MQSYNESLKKVCRRELSFIWERFCRRLEDLTTKSLKLKYCFRSILPLVLSNKGIQNTKSMQEKNPWWKAKSERPLAVSLTICEINKMHFRNAWRENQKLKLKLFIFHFMKIFTFHLHFLAYLKRNVVMIIFWFF